MENQWVSVLYNMSQVKKLYKQ